MPARALDHQSISSAQTVSDGIDTIQKSSVSRLSSWSCFFVNTLASHTTNILQDSLQSVRSFCSIALNAGIEYVHSEEFGRAITGLMIATVVNNTVVEVAGLIAAPGVSR